MKIDRSTQNDSNSEVFNPLPLEEMAAVKIQKCYRGYRVRKSYLPSGRYPEYLAQCNMAESSAGSSMPRAKDGKTPVFLPGDLPDVILKRSGRGEARRRFHQMQEVRSILQSQGASHLEIPKAFPCGQFLVEERLPIETDDYSNMGLYVSEPECFDEAVREMASLFTKGSLSDILQISKTGLGSIVGNIVRYDNLPLYIVGEGDHREARIGLIDLQRFNEGPLKMGFAALARIFPYHVDTIIKEAKKGNVEIDESLVRKSAKRGEKFLKEGYLDHLNWLRSKGEVQALSAEVLLVGDDTMERLAKFINEELQGINDGTVTTFKGDAERFGGLSSSFWNFLDQSKEQDVSELAHGVCASMIDLLREEFRKYSNPQLEENNGGSLSEPDIIRIRSVGFNYFEKLLEPIKETLIGSPAINFKENSETTNDHRYTLLAAHLIYVVMSEMVQENMLFSFYTHQSGRWWVKY